MINASLPQTSQVMIYDDKDIQRILHSRRAVIRCSKASSDGTSYNSLESGIGDFMIERRRFA